MRRDEELLQESAVRRARLVSAFTHGRQRSWADTRALSPAVLTGLLLAVAIAFGSGVTVVVRDQLAETRAQQQELEQTQTTDPAQTTEPTAGSTDSSDSRRRSREQRRAERSSASTVTVPPT
jgi:hypothetical protein